MSHHMNQIKLKARRQAKELQAELAIDMRMLEALLAETENEKEEAVKRKGELHHEAHAYMQYLDEQVQKEKEAERELESLINEEVGSYVVVHFIWTEMYFIALDLAVTRLFPLS